MPRLDPYQLAHSKPSSKIWPGCGDGRCMPCGRIHDFGKRDHDGKWQSDMRCVRNHHSGCPVGELPKPVHDWGVTNRCGTCRRKARWIAPDGSAYGSMREALTKGWKKQDLHLESDETDG